MKLEKGVASFDEKELDWYKYKPVKEVVIDEFEEYTRYYADDDDIADLKFSEKTIKVLKQNSITHIEDLEYLNFEQLLSLKGMENDVLQEIVSVVNIKGSEHLRSLEHTVYNPSEYGTKKERR